MDDTPTGDERAPRRRRRAAGRANRVAGAVMLTVTAAAAIAVVLLASGSAPRRASATGVPAGETTATVTRRTLSESATVNGTLGYGGERELYDRLAGTYTWLPAVGARIARGGTLFRLDNLPVVLMYGSVPAYRTLEQGVAKGPDVDELNANLIDLGYDPYGAIADDESFSDATAAAVRRFQRAEGLPETGKVELGRVIFAPGAQRVTAVHVSLGEDPPAAGPSEPSSPPSGSATPGEPPSTGTPSESSPSPKTPTPGSPSLKPGSKSPSSKKTKAGKPKGKKEKLPSSGAKSPSKSGTGVSKSPGAGESSKNPAADKSSKSPESSKSPSSGEGKSPGSQDSPEAGGGGEAVLSTTSTQQIVKLTVKPEQQRLAHLGEGVTVLLPGSGTVPGRITAVGTVASSAKTSPGEEKGGGGSGESGETTIEVTVTLDRPVAHLDEAPVSVELVKSISREVLTVPATALIATAGGRYAIEALEGDRRSVVPVTPGMFANDYVQVEGARVREGMAIVESE